MSQMAFNRAAEIKEKQYMKLFLGISLILNLLLGFSVSVLIDRVIIVYDDAGNLAVLNHKDLELDEPRLKEFVRMISREYLCFTPESLPKQIESISSYLLQEPAKAALESYDRNKKKIKEEKVFYDFLVKEIRLVNNSEPFRLEATGIRTVFINGKDISGEASYLFEVKRIRPTRENPYGLIASRIIEQKEEPKE
jgi:hypothetical protein